MKFEKGDLLMTFDCLSEGPSIKNAVTSMNRLAAIAGWRPKAVSVMSPDQINWPGDFTLDWKDQFQKAGEIALGKFLKRNRTSATVESKILFQPYHSRKGSIQTLLSEIDSTKPSAVAVFTHAHKKGSSLPAGFVSSLIAKSNAPVFVVNAEAPALKSLKTVIFATDFSDVDADAYKEALAFAKGVGAALVLIHVLPTLVNETMSTYAAMAGGWYPFEDYLELQEKLTKDQAARWVKKAEETGVNAKFEILNNSKTIWSGILNAANRHGASMIVMTEKTGPWEAMLIGSVTRKILELSKKPVLVLRGKPKPEHRKHVAKANWKRTTKSSTEGRFYL